MSTRDDAIFVWEEGDQTNPCVWSKRPAEEEVWSNSPTVNTAWSKMPNSDKPKFLTPGDDACCVVIREPYKRL